MMARNVTMTHSAERASAIMDSAFRLLSALSPLTSKRYPNPPELREGRDRRGDGLGHLVPVREVADDRAHRPPVPRRREHRLAQPGGHDQRADREGGRPAGA